MCSNLLYCFKIPAMHDFDKVPQNVTISPETSRSIIRLCCHINSVPEAPIKWEKDGVPVVDDNERYFMVLVI